MCWHPGGQNSMIPIPACGRYQTTSTWIIQHHRRSSSSSLLSFSSSSSFSSSFSLCLCLHCNNNLTHCHVIFLCSDLKYLVGQLTNHNLTTSTWVFSVIIITIIFVVILIISDHHHSQYLWSPWWPKPDQPLVTNFIRNKTSILFSYLRRRGKYCVQHIFVHFKNT